MADIIERSDTGVAKKRLKDMGDDSYADVVFIGGGTIATSGTVTAAGTTTVAGTVNVKGNLVPHTNKSGTIAAGGVAQTAIAANAARMGFYIQNASSGDLWISSLTTAVAASPSLRIPAGQLYEPPQFGVPSGAISIIGATTGQAFTAREW